MHPEHVQREKQEAQLDKRIAIEAKLAQLQSAAAQASFSKIKWRSSSLAEPRVKSAPDAAFSFLGCGGKAAAGPAESVAAAHAEPRVKSAPDAAFSFLGCGGKAAAGPAESVAAAHARGRAAAGPDHPLAAVGNGGDGDRAAVSFSKIKWRAFPFAGGETIGGAASSALRPTASLANNAQVYGKVALSCERPQTDDQACGQADEHRPGGLSRRAESLPGQFRQLPVPRQPSFASLCFEDEVSDDVLDALTSTNSAISKLAHDSKGLPMWGRTRPVPHAEAPSAKCTKGCRGGASDDSGTESDGESMSELEASPHSATSKLAHDSKGLPMWGRTCGNLTGTRGAET